MIEHILSVLFAFVESVIAAGGYWGIVALMAIESACIPLPSELIMPFSGFLVSKGEFNLWLCGLAGAVGCLVGSWIAYWVGVYGGRPFVEKYGKYILMSKRDLDRADRFFTRHGEATVFIARLLPIVRTYISLPAGISKMHFWRFSFYSLVGSFPWCLALAWVGMKLGDEWQAIRGYLHKFDFLVAAVLIILFALFLWHHFRPEEKEVAAEVSPAETKED